MRKVVFGLEPLSCPSCIQKIESSLNKLDGIELVFHPIGQNGEAGS